METWTGGDIGLVKTTDDGTVTNVWSDERCLRATVTYRDDVDRTHAEQDDTETAVDETLEGTFKGSEYPVKPIDENNEPPVFTDDGMADGNAESSYTAERREDASDEADTDSRTIDEAFPATDAVTNEDDDTSVTASAYGADILTYTLGGPDADAFTITGTVDNPGATDPHPTNPTDNDDGVLSFKDDHVLDFESKTRYTVTITATDPSGDADSVIVTVNITNFNEEPDWVTKAPNSPAMVVYAENGTADVGIYLADDPEGAGITYALVDDADDFTNVDAADIADIGRFSINSLDGNLSFKSSPNYEKPGDVAVDSGDDPAVVNNRYRIAVSATVADFPALTPPHAIAREVTVVVTNVNEAPVFSETNDTLEITENPDDPEKEPPSAAGYLYLLNRGVGKPAANLPAAPELDVGIPVVAADDDSTGTFRIGGYTDEDRDRVDGLTYTLSGTDAAHFHIVPATGQILTMEKLDYEAKGEYKVTVKATDPWDSSDSIDMTIEVIDVDEVPVPRVLVISGDASHTYEENGEDALGEYTVVAGGGAMVGAWSLDGTDASNFMLTGTGDSRMLKFASAPDYENPMGGANDDSNTYDVTIKVTDSSESDVYGTFAVSVTVTNVDELGALSGPTSASVNEGATDVVATYELSAIASGASYTYLRSLEGDDAGQFTLNAVGTTGVLELSFSSAPDYEMPADADGDNVYMVTVKVAAGGETEMVAVTIMVDNVDELGELSGPTSVSVMEGSTDALGHYTLSGVDGSNAQFSLDGADADYFMIDGSLMLKFSSAPDYEMPRGQELSDTNTNTYMVTVMAKAGGEMEMMAVTITVDNVEEAGTVILNTESPVVDSEVTATLSDLDGSISNVTWTWQTSSDDATWIAATGDSDQTREPPPPTCRFRRTQTAT